MSVRWCHVASWSTSVGRSWGGGWVGDFISGTFGRWVSTWFELQDRASSGRICWVADFLSNESHPWKHNFRRQWFKINIFNIFRRVQNFDSSYWNSTPQRTMKTYHSQERIMENPYRKEIGKVEKRPHLKEFICIYSTCHSIFFNLNFTGCNIRRLYQTSWAHLLYTETNVHEIK
jgi:hypothetical protein